MGPNSSYGKGDHPQVLGVKVSENIRCWCVKFSCDSFMCYDCRRACQVFYGVLVGVFPRTGLRARMVQLEHQAMRCVLGILYFRKSHGSLVNSKIQGWKRQKSRSQGWRSRVRLLTGFRGWILEAEQEQRKIWNKVQSVLDTLITTGLILFLSFHSCWQEFLG